MNLIDFYQNKCYNINIRQSKLNNYTKNSDIVWSCAFMKGG